MAGKRRRLRGEGTVTFDATRDRWIGRVWLDGKRRQVSAPTQDKCAEKLGRLIHGAEVERRTDRRLTVASLLRDWQSKSLPGRRLAPSTLETHAWCVSLLADELGSAKVAELDVLAVERALERLAAGSQGKELSRASLVKVRSTLRQALAWAERRQAVAFNAAAVAEIPHDAGAGERRRALSKRELKALFAVLDDPEKGSDLALMFRVMGTVGLRPGEAAALCVEALDLEQQAIAVTRSVQLRGGRPHLVDSLKTAGSRRTVTVPPALATALAAYVRTEQLKSGLLWKAPDGGPLWPSTVRAELADACARAKIDPPARPNELRHTAATRLAEEGWAPHELADLLGHRSTRMVDEFYRHRPAVVRGPDSDLW